MAGTIAYDRPVADFIDGLNATGHVTHTKHRKTSVTFHHNGGRLSLSGILDVWKVRPASAHFQVDGAARVGQYVKVEEYAWAAGNTKGNQESIHIEMADATLGPDWTVAEATWKEGARLCGWLHARVLGVRPSRATVHVHHDWKQTLCAGPFIDKMLNQMIADAQWAYDIFMLGLGGSAPAPAPAPETPWGSGKSIDVVAREVIHGDWGSGQDRANRLKLAGYDSDLVQRTVNAILSGTPIPAAPAPPAPARKSVSQLADEVLAGAWGNGPERSRRLAAAGYSPTDVQAEVNRRTGGKVTTRPSITAIAQQVIRNQWGSGAERQRRLAAAGYDYKAVQAEVNRLLK